MHEANPDEIGCTRCVWDIVPFWQKPNDLKRFAAMPDEVDCTSCAAGFVPICS